MSEPLPRSPKNQGPHGRSLLQFSTSFFFQFAPRDDLRDFAAPSGEVPVRLPLASAMRILTNKLMGQVEYLTIKEFGERVADAASRAFHENEDDPIGASAGEGKNTAAPSDGRL